MEGRPPKLLDQLCPVIRARNYSLRTQTSYHDWARRSILFHGKCHPREVRQLLGATQDRMRCEQVQPLTAAPSASPGARRSRSHGSRPQMKTMALNPSRCNADHGTASAFNRRLQSSLRRCQPQFQLHFAQRQH
jgi:hypothetical protein